MKKDAEPEPSGPTVKAEPKIYQKEEEKKRSAEETKIKVSLFETLQVVTPRNFSYVRH